MNRNPIFVRNIRNLTDARYFAAMEVDWISLELNVEHATFSKWHTMRDWISGVKLAAEVINGEESLISKIIIDANPDGMVCQNLDFLHLTGGIDLFLVSENLNSIEMNALITHIVPYHFYIAEPDLFQPVSKGNIYLEANWTTDSIAGLKSSGYSGGICFSGGEESAVGVRDFSLVDEMIELIRR